MSARDWTPIVLALVVGVLLGAATALGQGVLPDAVRSVSNSAGSWCLVAYVVGMTGPRRLVAAVAGSVALLALLGGYVLASAARGYPSSTTLLVFWGLAAIVMGPVLGLAAHAVRHCAPTAAAAGVAVMSGILVGEGAYGLLHLADTTSPIYWWGSIAIGLGLLTAVGCWRLRAARPIAVAASLTTLVGAAVVVLFSSDLIALL